MTNIKRLSFYKYTLLTGARIDIKIRQKDYKFSPFQFLCDLSIAKTFSKNSGFAIERHNMFMK